MFWTWRVPLLVQDCRCRKTPLLFKAELSKLGEELRLCSDALRAIIWTALPHEEGNVPVLRLYVQRPRGERADFSSNTRQIGMCLKPVSHTIGKD
jgi:hypothetical protein